MILATVLAMIGFLFLLARATKTKSIRSRLKPGKRQAYRRTV